MSDNGTTIAELPNDTAAEEAVLAMMMLGPEFADRAAAALPAGHNEFFIEWHATIYRTIASLHKSGTSVTDPVLIAAEMAKFTTPLTPEAILSKCADIWSNRPVASNLEKYAQLVHAAYVKREIIHDLTQCADVAYRPRTSPDEACQRASAALDRCIEIGAPVNSGGASIESMIAQVMGELGSPIDRKTCLSTGIVELDTKLIGLAPGQLVLIGARASRGKTALALGMIEYAILDEKVPVLFFSLEMPARDVVQRMILSIAGVSEETIRAERIDGPAWARMDDAAKRMRVGIANLIIRDGEHTIDDIVNIARLQKRRRDVRAVFVDQLSFIRMDFDDRYDLKLGEIVNRLKQRIAIALGVPVILLAQLNRKHESEERVPRMSDFRDSDTLAHHPDKILLPYQPRPEGLPKNQQQRFETGPAQIIIDKHRNGATGTVNVWWQADRARFLASSEQYTQPGLGYDR